VRYAQLEIKGTIYNKSIQISAYADDIDVVGWIVAHIKESFLALSAAAKKWD
jgi:hypothetical protein